MKLSGRNVGLYSAVDQEYFGRYCPQSWSTCHVPSTSQGCHREKVTADTGSLAIRFCWLRGTAACPGRPKGLPSAIAHALRTEDLRCEIATCNGKELDLCFHVLFVCEVFFIVFYGFVCSSHGTNISFSVFH